MSNDRLNQIFEMQAKLQKLHNHNFNDMSLKDKEQYSKDMILYLLDEVHELLREINFKSYKKVKKDINIDNIHEELADIGAFFNNLCLCWGVSPDSYFKAYKNKNQKNIARVSDKNY